MFGPRSTGSPQGAWRLAGWETQMSGPPRPPGRTAGSEELMYRLRPSLEIAGLLSLYGELTTGPRLTGADHADQVGASLPSASANNPPTVGPAGAGRSAGSQAIARAHSKSTAVRSVVAFTVSLLDEGLTASTSDRYPAR